MTAQTTSIAAFLTVVNIHLKTGASGSSPRNRWEQPNAAETYRERLVWNRHQSVDYISIARIT